MSDLYIDTPEALERLCDRLRGAEWLALDTEFIRERTYYPRLCLLQVADDEVVACIDPLALPDLEPLLDVLFDPTITKVLHAAHQDLEILFQLRGAVPGPVFDTQIAATVLGGGEQIGYGALVKAELGVELAKAHARADWCHRPLEPDQLEYAADDVRYLREIYHRQLARLAELGREHWLTEDFEAMSDAGRYTVTPGEEWLRIKGAGRLKGVQLAVLQGLAAWREREAVSSNRPRRWILRDEVLLDIARQLPDGRGRLERIRGMEEKVARRHGDTLVEIVSQARQQPKERWPHLPPGTRLAPEQDELIDALMAVLRARCRIHGVSPVAVAARRDLERLVLGEKDVPLLHGWRYAVAGESLASMLGGGVSMRVSDGKLLIEER